MNPISSYNPSIAALPREILELTCNYLNDAKDLIHFASAHKKFHFLASTDPLSAPLWNLLLRKDFPTSYTRLKTEAASLDFYKALARIEHNMKNGKQRLQTLSHEYDPTLYDILTFYLAIWKDKLISFPCWSPPQCDCTVKVWNLKTVIAEKHLLLVESYDSLIKCTRIVKDKLILGLCAGEIKIWDLNHVEKKPTILSGHRGEILCIKNVDDTLISASSGREGNGEIKIWDLNTGQKLDELSVSDLSCIHIAKDKIISGSLNGTIRIWDFKTSQEPQALDGQSRITSIKSTKDKLITSSSLDGRIRTWDLDTGQKLHTLVGHHGVITCMKIVREKLISGSSKGEIKIWDLNTGKQLQDLNGVQARTLGIVSLKIVDKFIISGSFDGVIQIWDLNTGKELQEFLENPACISCMKIVEGKLFSSRIDGTLEVRDFNSFPD